MIVLFDTNVIVDSLFCRENFYENSNKLILAVAEKEIDGCITSKALTDIYYLLKHELNNEQETRNKLQNIMQLFSICSVNGYDCQKALFSEVNDYEDAVMVETAIRENVDCIVSRDKDLKNVSKIKIFSPKELLEYIC